MKYELGRILRWVLVVALLLLAIVCRVTAGALTESVWGRYAKERGLAPEAVGTQAQEDTPRARSVADMERLELFTVEEAEAWEEGNLFFLGQENTLYKILVLESGERVAARYSRDGYEYNTATGLWASPVGRWVPWELTETERASVEWKDLDLTTLDYYADMLGEERDIAHADFRSWFPWLGSLTLMAAAVFLILLVRLLLWPVRESNRAQSDVECWLAGTHAIWGQSIARFSRVFPSRRPIPIRFGGLPRTPVTRWLIRSTLRGSWEITSYAQLLETVEYMSRGPGFTNCNTQTARAWQLCRSSSLLGMAMVLGWASREELVQRSREVGKLIQSHFSSWDELSTNFLEYFANFRVEQDGEAQESGEIIRDRVDSYWSLKKRPDGPFSLPWNLDLNETK